MEVKGLEIVHALPGRIRFKAANVFRNHEAAMAMQSTFKKVPFPRPKKKSKEQFPLPPRRELLNASRRRLNALWRWRAKSNLITG
jgi:hypothetical protein